MGLSQYMRTETERATTPYSLLAAADAAAPARGGAFSFAWWLHLSRIRSRPSLSALVPLGVVERRRAGLADGVHLGPAVDEQPARL